MQGKALSRHIKRQGTDNEKPQAVNDQITIKFILNYTTFLKHCQEQKPEFYSEVQ